MEKNTITKDWGKGIPKYAPEDVMTPEELLDFAMEIVTKYEIEKNEYEVVSVCRELGQYPNFIVKADGRLWFIIVKATVAPKMPVLIPEVRELILEHGKKYGAECYFAPVCFGSEDDDRFEASLALRGDGFYTNYRALEPIEPLEEDIKKS